MACADRTQIEQSIRVSMSEPLIISRGERERREEVSPEKIVAVGVIDREQDALDSKDSKRDLEGRQGE
jgi:hypothetical protein